MVENGQRPDENQVSSTSGSWRRDAEPQGQEQAPPSREEEIKHAEPPADVKQTNEEIPF